MKDKNALKTEFPSPTGVLYLLIGWNLEAKTLFGMFPSPTGVLYLLILI